MKRYLTDCAGLLAVAFATSAAIAQEKSPSAGAASAELKAAQRLADLLVPGGAANTSVKSGPLARRTPGFLEHPEAPLPTFIGVPPRLPLPLLAQARPHNPGEEAPLAKYRKDPALPEAIELAHGPLVRVPSLDVQQPVPLPILAKPAADRVSVADPTLEASVAAILGAVAAQRTVTVPFVPLNLPDPFENAQAIRLRFIPDEAPSPPPSTPRTPK